MTDHANDAVPTIGPATEARLQLAFADACLITAKSAARLLGLDEGTLRTMADKGIIRSVRRGTGSVRAYTEGDIRTYLTQGDAPAREEKPKPRATVRVSRNVVPFTQRKRA